MTSDEPAGGPPPMPPPDAPLPPDASPPPDETPRRGAVATRDDRRTWLWVGAAAGLVVAAVLLGIVARIVADGGDDAPANAGAVPGELGRIVPIVTASPTVLARGDEADQVGQLLGRAQTELAASTPAYALCAAVALQEPITVSGRWERNGHEVASTDARRVGAPGFGDCLDDGGAALPGGTYQFVVRDDQGRSSAPATLVLGATPISQTFVNDGEQPICVVRLAPRAARVFATYDFASTPIGPGASVTLPVAAVRQVVSATPCDAAVPRAEFAFHPDSTRPQSLLER